MLELKSVTWKNFMSYGDYETTIELDNLGQCLIIGEVIDEDKTILDQSQGMTNIPKSNGAGKSTCLNAIQWALFGRTMHSSSPGDKVINYFTGKNCWVKLDFKNGDFIARTRAVDGHNELLYIKDGNETNLTSDTISTTKNQQIQLNKEFGLDWEIFCGSVFFNQYGKPWMEMADQSRKKAIERILHIDRFTYYANTAKAKSVSIDNMIQMNRQRIKLLNDNINSNEGQLERIKTASENYHVNKESRISSIKQDIAKEEERQQAIILPDIENIKKSWDIVNKINEKIAEQELQINKLRREKQKLQGDLDSLKQRKKLWESKSGKICTSCEQKVPEEHTSSRIEPLEEQISTISKNIENLKSEINSINNNIEKINALLEQKSPKITLNRATEIHRDYDNISRNIKRLNDSIVKINEETNPHMGSLDELKERIELDKTEIIKLEEETEEYNFLNKHYIYIHKAYNDRSKIKSHVFKQHIPYINSRLSHYLDVFGLDVKIELTPALGITSNMWGYEFESGGERKRTDVAFMFAIFDFHEQMYGRQCNILGLDEVDGRLDDDGIDSLVSIIKNDLAPKVETILIISHRNMMFDTFSREIKVSRTDRFSQLVLS